MKTSLRTSRPTRGRNAAAGNGPGEPVVDRRRNNSRALIKDVASQLFFAHGYEVTSIRTIVDACNLTPAAFYNHFATKEELLYEIVAEGHATVGVMMQDALREAAGDPVRELAAIVSAYVRFHTHHQVFALVANAEYGALPEPRLSAVRAERVRLRGLFEDVIERGASIGRFGLVEAGGMSSSKLAAVAIGDMCLRVAEWYRPEEKLASSDVEQAYAAFALRLVGAEP